MKKYCLYLIVFLTQAFAHAQTVTDPFKLPVVAAPSPTAAALGRYGEIPVSIQSGVPNISIPIYEVNTGKQKLPVSISFHASGIKVMDQQGAIGLGWALNAGGLITRVVKGTLDEGQSGWLDKIFPEDNDPALADKLKCMGIQSQYGPNLPEQDLQPDQFFYNFPGKAGKFIYKNVKVDNIHPGFMTIPFDPIKIDHGTLHQDYFRIIDQDGTEYVFGKRFTGEKVVETSYISPQGDYWTRGGWSSTWHLTGMISADKTDTISFTYVNGGNNMVTNNSTVLIGKVINVLNGTMGFEKQTSYGNSSTHDTWYVSTINFRNGQLQFEYNDLTNSVAILQRIKIMARVDDGLALIKKFEFTRSDEQLASVTEVGADGLALPPFVFQYEQDASGNMKRPPYNSKGQDLWGYYNAMETNTDLLWVDGYNNTTAIYSTIHKRKPNETHMKYGQIKKITYPAGGYTDFVFEPNKKEVVTYRYDTTWNTLSGYITTFSMSPGNQSSATSIFTVPYVLDMKYRAPGVLSNAVVEFSSSKICAPSGTCAANTRWVRLLDITGGGSTTIIDYQIPSSADDPYYTFKWYVNLEKDHTYKLYFPTPGNITTVNQMTQYRLDATVQGQSFVSVTATPLTEAILGGGMRIKQIIHHDNYGHSTMKEYLYTKPYFNSDMFGGDFDLFATSTYGHQKLQRGFAYNEPRPFYMTWTENLTVPLGSMYNTSIAYEEVEEYDKDVSTGNVLGKTVYAYNKAIDFVPHWMPLYKDEKDYIRNQLLSKKVYRKNGSAFELIRTESTVYKDLDEGLPSEQNSVKAYVAERYWLGGQGDERAEPWNPVDYSMSCGFFYGSRYRIEPIYIRSPRIVPAEKYAINHSPETATEKTVQQTLEYENIKHVFPTKVTSKDSKGDILVSKYKRPLDFEFNSNCTDCEAALVAQLQAARNSYLSERQQAVTDFYYQIGFRDLGGNPTNITQANAAKTQYAQYLQLVQQLETQATTAYNSCVLARAACKTTNATALNEQNRGIYELQEKNNIIPVLEQKELKNDQLLSTKVTEYKLFPEGYVLPRRVKEARFELSLEEKGEFLQYIKGNIAEMRKANDVVNAYIWNYNQEYPIAEVTGGYQDEIAYTSFEADGTGNWSVNNTRGPGGVTGKRNYHLSWGNISCVTGRVQDYTVSYWSQGSQYNIPGTFSVRSSVFVNGWKYFEHLVKGQSSIIVTGSGWIDELRLYPAKAFMKTYTFDALRGMTSAADENSEVSYYEYDQLGRLKLIRDKKGNIIKLMDYQYAVTP